MAARRRSNPKRGWPPNLYERGGYYSWRNPLDGKEYGLGRDKRSAFVQAVEANLHAAGMLENDRLIDRLTGEADRTVSDAVDRFLKDLTKRAIKLQTLTAFRQRLATIRAKLGDLVLARVETRHIAEFLREYKDADKMRMAQSMRSLLMDLFVWAKSEGLLSGPNPVTDTNVGNVSVKRARLTLNDFRVVYVEAKKRSPWVARSMELAIVTAQRREDIAELKFSDVNDGMLWIVQKKTGTGVAIPLSIHLNALRWSLGEIIERCRDRVVSRLLVHHSAHAGLAKPGDKVRLHTITAEFSQCVRLAKEKATHEGRLDLFQWPKGSTPPTFHEIRSLAARLYADQGIDVQALLGHKSPNMTAVYRDVRGAEWIEVKVG